MNTRAAIPTVALLLLTCLTAGAEDLWTLERALAEAGANPDARIAELRMREAQALVRQADSGWWPKLSVQSSYSRTDNPIGVFGAALNQRAFSPALNFNDVPDADNLQLQGTVTAPLYSGGLIPATRDAARQNAGAVALSADAVRQRLALEVVRMFYTIAQTDAYIEAAEASVAAFRGNLEIARKRQEAGTALKVEVLDLEVRLAQAESDTVSARNANELARRAFANLLGRENEAPLLAPVTSAPVMPDPGSASPRPELQSAALQRAAADSKVREAESGFRPKVSAFLSGEHNRGWRFNGSGESYTAGVMVQWNVWDGFLTRGRVDEAKAGRALAEEQERRVRLGVDLETQQARLNAEASAERLKVATKAVALAAESAHLTRIRFEQGLALATQLIDSESALTGAQVRRAQSEGDYRIAVATLRYALGLPQLDTPAPSQP